MLDIWDNQLADLAEKVYEYRLNYVNKISNRIQDIHKLITKSGKLEEEIQIKYSSNCKDKNNFLESLNKLRDFDISRGFTSIGVHRDDLIISINKKPVKVFGSQGQQRIAVLCLKLSEIEIFKKYKDSTPILLLDDVFSELDIQKKNNLLKYIDNDMQVIITTTDLKNIDKTIIKMWILVILIY